MKKNYIVKLKVLVTLLIMVTANSIGQITLGSDNAGNYGTWTNSSNAGTGFTPWDLFANTTAGGSAGHFLASLTADGFKILILSVRLLECLVIRQAIYIQLQQMQI